MKKFLILTLASLTLACSNDKDDNTDDIEIFRLTKYQITFITLDTYGEDDVIWSFNFTTNVLTVENNVSITNTQLVPSGMYDFTFENNVIAFEYNMLNYEADFDLSENDTVLELFFDLYPNVVDDEFLCTFERI